MYGILAFNNKGDSAELAEFRAESGKYGRGSACKGCRISRVKCSGKLDASDCDRCKRLRIPCHYTNNPSRRNGSSSNNSNNNSQARGSSISSSTSGSAVATPPAKPGPTEPLARTESYVSSTLSSPRIEPTSWDDLQMVPDEFQLGLDFDMWLQLHNPEPPSTLGTVPKDNASSTVNPQMCWEPQSILPALGQSEPSGLLHQQSDTCDTDEADVTMGIAGQEFTDLKLSPMLGDGGAGLSPGPASSSPQATCTCQQSTTSLLSVLRGWALGGGPSAKLGIDTGGHSINCSKIGDFLVLFEESIVQLDLVKDCHMACIRSQDLAILLLLVVEQLAKLLLSLAASFPVEGPASGGGLSHLDLCSRYVSQRRPQIPRSISTSTCSTTSSISNNISNNNNNTDNNISRSTSPGEDGLRLKIGSFEVRDAPDLIMITKILLQIRTRALESFICRLGEKIRAYGLRSLDVELNSIRDDLSRITGGLLSPDSFSFIA
ncbi:hypothetical protein F5Y17DRAFT_433204 [Xylariaceae sp. FL0594]|nr:hypothetical protein F5Y17DRAFT_433204 [Xylariaceae sp. FL0594]